MADAIFEHPRLVGVYDALELDRSDLEGYAALLRQVGARTVLDVGCGTGTFAVMLAEQGLEVTGVDPAAGSLAVARRKAGADRVRWICGDATGLPPLQVDAATMTANVAQAIVDAADWDGTLRVCGVPCDRAGTCSSRRGTRRTAPGSSGRERRRTPCTSCRARVRWRPGRR